MTARTLLLCTGFLLVCFSDLVFNLENSSLQHVPFDFPLNITKINLSSNFIEITKADFDVLKKYTLLTELYLDNNRITTVPGQVFDTLSQLKILNLSHSNISTIQPSAFKGLVNLKELDLSYNVIQSLPSWAFASLWNLETLLLQGNRLQSIESGIFSNCTKLRVNLEDNHWNCSCAFKEHMKQMNNRGLQIISSRATCISPKEQAGRSIMNTESMCLSGSAGKDYNGKSFDKDLTTLPSGNTWKFLAGVLVTTLSTSLLLLCGSKFPSWYKRQFQYRHQRLAEEEPYISTVEPHASFILDTKQTAAGRQDDEDGYIEDCYIETAPVPNHDTISSTPVI